MRALRGTEKSGLSNRFEVRTPLPPAEADLIPTNLAAEFVPGGVSLAWDAPAADSASVTGYEILRAVGDGAMTILVADTATTATAYTDTTATGTDKTYAYSVAALRGGQKSRPSKKAWAVPLDTVPPQLRSVWVDGAEVTLAYSEPLDAGSTPAAGAFSVTVGGAAREVTTVTVAGSSVRLTLASPTGESDAVSVSYAAPSDPAAARVQDLAGNPAASFENETPPDHLTPPRNVRVLQAENGRITLAWDAPASDGGSAVRRYQVRWTWNYPNGSVMKTALTNGLSPTITGLRDGVEYVLRVVAENANDKVVSEHVRATPRDTIPPRLLSAWVDRSVVTLAYSEPLDSDSVPEPDAFGVIVGGISAAIGEVSVADSLVKLTLASPVAKTGVVSVSYAVPNDPAAARIQDPAGNPATSFDDVALAHSLPPPRDLSVSLAENGRIALSWDAPAPQGFFDITGYIVEWQWEGRDGDLMTRQAPVNSRSRMITGLTDGVEYELRVVALDDAGNSAASGGVRAAPRDTIPPRLLYVLAQGAEVTLAYSELLDRDSTPPADAFTATVGGAARGVSNVSVVDSSVKLALASPAAESDTVSLSYAAPNDPATARIQDPGGNPTASFEDQTPTADLTPPGNVRVLQAENGRITLSWEAPVLDGGHPVSHYMVNWTRKRQNVTISKGSSTTGLSHTISGLANGVEYSVRVTVDNMGGDRASSNRLRVTPRDANPPRLLTAAADASTVILTYSERLDPSSMPGTDSFSVTVGGQARAVSDVSMDGPLVRLTLEPAASSGQPVSVSYTAPPAAGAARIQDLWGNPAVSFEGETAVQAGVPGPPRNLAVELPDNELLRVTWEAPASDGGSDILEYRVQWKPGNGGYDTLDRQAVVSGAARSHDIGGLANGTLYTLRVIAVNGFGDGPPSAEVSETPVSEGRPLRQYIEGVVAEHETDNSWLRETWEYMKGPGFVLRLGDPEDWAQGSVEWGCSRDGGLATCEATGMEIRPDSLLMVYDSVSG